MDKLINFLTKYRLAILTIGILSLLWFMISVIFIDNRWWWFMFELTPISLLILYLYRELVYVESRLNYVLRYTIGWLFFASSIFILICAIFITPWWWFGVLIPFLLLVVWVSLAEKYENNPISQYDKTKVIYTILLMSIIFFCLFCIPSFIANHHVNPKESFSSNYQNNTVDSYTLYGDVAERDREHVIAQSWYPTNKNYVNDIVNVIWSSKYANNQRGNLAYRNVNKNHSNAVVDNNIIVGYKENGYFMPTDEFKGDVARIILYMYVTYKDDGLPLEYIDINLMKDWALFDLVDQREKDRNHAIRIEYEYGNQFVELPWLIGFIV